MTSVSIDWSRRYAKTPSERPDYVIPLEVLDELKGG
jgi:hypothetical protein